MKNIILLITSTLLGIILGYIIFVTFFYFTYDDRVKNSIFSKEKFVLINKYTKNLNHIRPKNSNSSELIFSKINSYKNYKNILMQGDSWFAQINFPTNDNAKSYRDVNIKNPKKTDYKSLRYIQEWSQSKNIGLINGGTGSYSPSLMSVQLDVLEKDFQIRPDILISYIDQTDLGDENCRYKPNKVYSAGELTKVTATQTLTRQAFDYSKMLKLSEINLSSKPKVLKALKLVNYEIEFQLKKFFKINLYKITKIFSEGWSKRKIKKCNVQEILSYLQNPKDDDVNYFKAAIKEYLYKAYNKKHIKKIYLVSFPHMSNLKNIYEKKNISYLNVSDIIDEVLVENRENFGEKILHINFTKIITSQKGLFVYEDYLFDKIHLKQRPHKLFISEIFRRIN